MKVKDIIITLCFMNGLASIIGFACLTEINIIIQVLIIFLCAINAFSMLLAEQENMEYNLLALNTFSIFTWVGALLYTLEANKLISSIILGGIILLNLISLYILINIAFFHKGD